ncbi:MAG: hypothetical protein LUI85_05050 [Bacteroides sp.]|nr:hypothetical protein [Bacteroides sp.]
MSAVAANYKSAETKHFTVGGCVKMIDRFRFDTASITIYLVHTGGFNPIAVKLRKIWLLVTIP